MKTIHEFVLNSVAEVLIKRMPIGAKILCLHMQGQELCLWAEVEDGAQFENRMFLVLGTGMRFHPDSPKTEYIGTAHQIDFEGHFVWHVYEVLK